jgi:hypothetical protein
MRDLETIDSELRLLAAVRREYDGRVPSIGPIDELLDERGSGRPRAGRDSGTAEK